MANVGNVVRLIAIKGTHEGVDEASAAVQNLAKQYGGVAVETEKVSRASISVERAWKRQTLTLDETARAQDKMAIATKNANAAMAQGLTDQAGVTRHLGLMAVQYGLVSESANRLTAGMSGLKVAAEAAAASVGKPLDVLAAGMAKAGNFDAMASDRMVAGLTKAGDAGTVAAQRLIAGMSGIKTAAVEAGASKPFDPLVTGMTAAGDVSAVASHKMVAGMSAMGKEAAAAAPQIDKVTVSQAALTKQSSRNAAEMLNLGRQFADVAVSLQAGQSILVVGLQQGAQIIDVIASSQRSMGQIASQAASWAGRFIMSTAGVVAGIAAIALGAGMLAANWQESQREIDRALIGVGKRAGLTKGDINGLAEANASSAKLSVSEWRGAALEFVKTGNIYGENVVSLSNLVKGFANTIGESSEEAAKQLAKIFSGDVASAADKLNEIYGNISGRTREYARDLEVAGKRQEAIAVIAKEMRGPIQDAVKITGFWAASWDAISRTAKDIADSTGKFLSGMTGVGQADKDRLANLEKELKLIEEIVEKRAGRVQSFQDKGATEQQAKLLVPELEPAMRELTRLRVEYEKLKIAIQDAGTATADSQLMLIGKQADDAVKAFLPYIEQLKNIEMLQNRIREAGSKQQQGQDPQQGVGGFNQEALNASEVLKMNTSATAENQARLNAYAVQVTQTYGTQNIEVAKTLDSLTRQLPVAQAVGGMAQIEAQHKARVAELSTTLEASEAERIADAERLAALAQIEAQHQQTMVQLRGQLDVASQVTGIEQINAQYEATVASLELQIGSIKATEQAELQRATAIAQVNANADRTLKSLEQQGELIRASTESEKERIRARQTYQNLVDQGVSSEKAQAVASKQRSNEENARTKRELEAQEKALANIRTRADAWKAYADGVISWSLANDEAGKANVRNQEAANRAAESALATQMEARHQQDLMYQQSIKFTGLLVNWHYLWDGIAESVSDVFSNLKEGKDIWNVGGNQISQFNPAGYTSTIGTSGAPGKPGDVDKFLKEMWERQFNAAFTQAGGDIGRAVNNLLSTGTLFQGTALDTDKVSAISSAIDLLPKEQQIGPYQQMLEQFKAKPLTLETAPIVKQLTDKIAELTSATDANTSATNAQTDVLSPFYSSDPRRTHLGFRAFAGGGIMSQYGELPLRHYQGGGMATSPQVAVFGEGSTPEAYVPIPSGRIPVEVKTPANNNQKQRPVVVNINVMGNADAGTVAALKTTAFQQAQAMRRMMG